jgi:hypothetical protein
LAEIERMLRARLTAFAAHFRDMKSTNINHKTN